MHIILTGATGTIGAPVLRHCLANPNVTKLSILSRRDFDLPLPTDAHVAPQWNTKKAQIIVHKDYTSYPPEVLAKLQGAESVIWAQGVSQFSVSKDEYVRITNGYPMAAARAFPSLSPTGRFTFVHVSGDGATREDKGSLYGRTKGRTELDLLSLSSSFDSNPSSPKLDIYNARPGYVDPEGQPIPGRPLAQRIFVDGLIGPVLRKVNPEFVSPTSLLAKALVDLALGDGQPLPDGSGIQDDGRTIRAVAIRRLGQ